MHDRDGALEALAEVNATAPPVGLRRRLLAEARVDLGRDQLQRRAVRWRLVGAVAATLALGLGGVLAGNVSRLEDKTQAFDQLAAAHRKLVATGHEHERALVALRAALDTHASVLRVVAGPRVQTASLAPTERHAGTGSVHLDTATGRGAVVLAGVDAPARDRVYALWAIRGDAAPEPAGLLTSAAPGVFVGQVGDVQDPSRVTAFAVSVEPMGGSPAPTGPVVLVGALRS